MFNIQIVSNMVTDAWKSYLKSDSLFHTPTMDGFHLKKKYDYHPVHIQYRALNQRNQISPSNTVQHV